MSKNEDAPGVRAVFRDPIVEVRLEHGPQRIEENARIAIFYDHENLPDLYFLKRGRGAPRSLAQRVTAEIQQSWLPGHIGRTFWRSRKQDACQLQPWRFRGAKGTKRCCEFPSKDPPKAGFLLIPDSGIFSRTCCCFRIVFLRWRDGTRLAEINLSRAGSLKEKRGERTWKSQFCRKST